MKISIETIINAPLNLVWLFWVNPDDIKNWHFASSDWFCPFAQIDLVEGGKFNYRMEAKDGSMGFDFEGEFTAIVPLSNIRYKLEDNREVDVQFSEYQGQTTIAETFEVEDEHSAEQQRQGWLMILESFKQHVEHKKELERT